MNSSIIPPPSAFPKKASFDRVIPKSRIYENANSSARVKQLFVDQVERIRWSYKLSPTTLNLPASDGVEEIQVFTIDLREDSLKHEVLLAIDKAIPSPIIFILNYNGKLRYVAAYKRVSEADKSKRVISGYFETEWLTADSAQREMPVALNMGGLYQALLKSIIPLAARRRENLPDLTARIDQLRAAEREALRIELRMTKEKHFKRKVELNRMLNELRREIDKLKG
ncbi:MAG: DUF4391 domain-containing protein [Kiritimatiellae bacterium]|nr:DUF4391 domain-containing protein [Kiritimatiellia bacterium]